ncbi:MAG TPA: alpha-amylase family glycosyl hydrolase [Stellaceae bacterium]|nr:alpha-amylase family glycosyl hydrolase [Stellaceae bacterium]
MVSTVHREWWRGAVIYQVYLPSFFDTDGDGFGDLKGLLERLPHIASLGVDAIWISPFYRSPMRDFGYDVADYRSVDPRFGTLADFDAVVARAHALGLKIIIDQVWSHTAGEHAWFAESRASRTNPKADWYVWADPASDGVPPNNWLSVFGGSAWCWDASRRQYYLHHFLTSQPKLNLRNPAVLDAHFANAEFWLARGVDGFRFDAVDFMLHDEALGSNPVRPLQPGADRPWNPFRMQRHVHDMTQPGIALLMSRIREFVNRFPGCTTIGEISSEPGAFDRIARLTGVTRLHMAYTLGVMKAAFTPGIFRQAVVDAGTLNHAGWLCWAFSNHDVERAVSRWNPAGRAPAAFARLQMAMLLSLQGSVCLYQGEELGLPNSPVSAADIRDPFGRAFYPAYVGRDGARTPMPWAADAPNAGFSNGNRTWLPVDPVHAAMAVDRQEADGNSTLATYRRMIGYRRARPSLALGETELFDLPDPVVGWRCRLDGEATIALFNLSPQPVSVPANCLPPFAPADLPFVTAPSTDGIVLPPFGLTLGTQDGHR